MLSSLKLRRSSRDLSTPRYGDRFGYHYDPEGFGRFSEQIAHRLGTAKFLLIQTAMVIMWFTWNSTAPEAWRFDKYPFILLNLILSCLAALQGAILLIAAKREDQISSDLAQHDYETNLEADRIVKEIQALTQEIHAHVVQGASRKR